MDRNTTDGAPSPDERAQVAARMLAQRTVLVSRIRQQLGQRGLAPQLADDIFSTTIRRTDALLAAGRVVRGVAQCGARELPGRAEAAPAA